MWLVYFGMCVHGLFMLLSGWTCCFSHPHTEHSQSRDRRTDESAGREKYWKPLPGRRIKASKKFPPCFVKAADTVMRCPRVHGSAGCWQRARLFPRKEAEGDKARIQYFPGDGSVHPVWAFSIFAAWCLFALGSEMTWWDLGEARGQSIASWSKNERRPCAELGAS